MVNAMSSIANGGTLYRPTLIQQIVGRVIPRRGVLRHPTVIQPFVPTIIRRNFIDPTNIALIQQGLHESVTLPGWTGTSYYVKDPRIDPAGKTGTAETPRTDQPDAWWLGYAPFNNPQVAVVVMVPYAAGEGAYVAAPIAHKLLEDYFHVSPILEPPATTSWVQEVQQQLVGNTGGSQ
jgi:penicillin-binding protein 2